MQVFSRAVGARRVIGSLQWVVGDQQGRAVQVKFRCFEHENDSTPLQHGAVFFLCHTFTLQMLVQQLERRERRVRGESGRDWNGRKKREIMVEKERGQK